MKTLKRFFTGALVLGMTVMAVGCSDGVSEEQAGTRFKLKYEASQGVDKVIYSIDDAKHEVNLMHDQKEIVAGYVSNVMMEEAKEVKFSIEIIDDGKVVYEKSDELIQLVYGKTVEVEVVDDEDGKFDLVINYTK